MHPRLVPLLALLLVGVPDSSGAPGSPPAAAPPATGRALFLKTCAPCHSQDGSASTPAARKLGVKDLRLSRIPDADIARQIRDGILDPKGQQKMPAFRETLTPSQIDSLLPVVKALRRAPR